LNSWETEIQQKSKAKNQIKKSVTYNWSYIDVEV